MERRLSVLWVDANPVRDCRLHCHRCWQRVVNAEPRRPRKRGGRGPASGFFSPWECEASAEPNRFWEGEAPAEPNRLSVRGMLAARQEPRLPEWTLRLLNTDYWALTSGSSGASPSRGRNHRAPVRWPPSRQQPLAYAHGSQLDATTTESFRAFGVRKVAPHKPNSGLHTTFSKPSPLNTEH